MNHEITPRYLKRQNPSETLSIVGKSSKKEKSLRKQLLKNRSSKELYRRTIQSKCIFLLSWFNFPPVSTSRLSTFSFLSKIPYRSYSSLHFHFSPFLPVGNICGTFLLHSLSFSLSSRREVFFSPSLVHFLQVGIYTCAEKNIIPPRVFSANNFVSLFLSTLFSFSLFSLSSLFFLSLFFLFLSLWKKDPRSVKKLFFTFKKNNHSIRIFLSHPEYKSFFGYFLPSFSLLLLPLPFFFLFILPQIFFFLSLSLSLCFCCFFSISISSNRWIFFPSTNSCSYSRLKSIEDIPEYIDVQHQN